MIETGNRTGKMIASFDIYHYVQKEEFNGIEIGKTWPVWRAWTLRRRKMVGAFTHGIGQSSPSRTRGARAEGKLCRVVVPRIEHESTQWPRVLYIARHKE